MTGITRAGRVTSEPLICLPGMLCDAALWAEATVGLACQTPVLAGDSIHAMATQLLQSLPARFALAGHSMGGYVALEVRRLAPHRVTGLALVNTSARADTDKQARGRQRAIGLVESGRFAAVVDALVLLLVHPSRHADLAFMSAVAAMLHRAGAETFLRQQRATGARQDQRATLAKIDIPTLVITGDGDRVVAPDDSRDIAMNVPGASLVTLNRIGHLAPMETPHRVATALRHWLKVDAEPCNIDN